MVKRKKGIKWGGEWRTQAVPTGRVWRSQPLNLVKTFHGKLMDPIRKIMTGPRLQPNSVNCWVKHRDFPCKVGTLPRTKKCHKVNGSSSHFRFYRENINWKKEKALPLSHFFIFIFCLPSSWMYWPRESSKGPSAHLVPVFNPWTTYAPEFFYQNTGNRTVRTLYVRLPHGASLPPFLRLR